MPGIASFGAASAPRVVASRGGMLAVGATTTGANSVCIEGRTRHCVAFDTPWLSVSDCGFYVDGNNVEQPLGASTIERSIEIPSLGAVVRRTYSGGNTGAIASGATEVSSDQIPASAFGLSAFPAGLIFWERFRRTVDAGAGALLPIGPVAAVTGYTGEGFAFSDGLSASQVMNQGAITVPTGGSLTNNGFLPMAIVGAPNHCVSVMALGDSIVFGASDNWGDGGSGGGWFARGLYNVRNRGIAWANYGRSTSTAFQWNTGAVKRRTYHRYFTNAFVHYGTNDMAVSARSAAQTNTALTTLAATLRTDGLRFLSASGCWIRCDNLNVPISGYANGGALREPYNALLAANAAFDEYNLFDAACRTSAGADTWKGGTTVDWVHPNASVSPTIGADLTPIAAAWRPW